jgi:hypothetical protein
MVAKITGTHKLRALSIYCHEFKFFNIKSKEPLKNFKPAASLV